MDNYLVALVTSDYDADNSPWIYAPFPEGQYNRHLQDMLQKGTLERMEKRECIKRYLDISHRHKDVVIVSANTTMHDMFTLTSGKSNTSLIELYQDISRGQRWMDRCNWLCATIMFETGLESGKSWCTPEFLLPTSDSWTLKANIKDVNGVTLKETAITVDYCLSAGLEAGRNGCAIRYSLVLLTIVTIFNAIKLLCIYATWRIHRRNQRHVTAGGWQQQHLVTLGDAISSFLRYEDEYTQTLPFLERSDCYKKIPTTAGNSKSSEAQKKLRMVGLEVKERWFRAWGMFRWGSAIFLYALALPEWNLEVYLPTDVYLAFRRC